MNRLYDKFVTILGDIKVFRHPLWIAYDPGSYRVKGPECRTITDLLEPGDILLRHYDGYLDNAFIPGVFSHAGLHLGMVTESDKVDTPTTESGRRAFEAGPCQVAHSTAEGVHLEDVLTFLRCDEVAVVRMPDRLESIGSIPRADRLRLHPEEEVLRARIEDGVPVARQEAFEVARRLALGQLGTEYDFDFDFHDGNRMSCTEFVLHCYRSVNGALGVTAREDSFLGGIVRKYVVRPDAFVSAPFRLLHASDSANEKLRRSRLQSI